MQKGCFSCVVAPEVFLERILADLRLACSTGREASRIGCSLVGLAESGAADARQRSF